jgi:hypothetical protein
MNFVPYRVDLTPFAATLSNGQQHTISLSVFNSDNYFSATASLLLYLDSGSTSVTGALTRNTLSAAPVPVVTENLNVGNTITGTVRVTSNRPFTLAGYVNTSHGKVTTTISQVVNFSNYQRFNITSTEFVQNILQNSNVTNTTTVATTGQPTVTSTRSFQFPVTLDISQITQSNGDINQTTKAWQSYNVLNTTQQGGVQTYKGVLTNTAQHQDTLTFDSNFNLLGNSNQSASQRYSDTDSTGVNLYCALTAANNALTTFSPTCSQ